MNSKSDNPNAWLAISLGAASNITFDQYSLLLEGERTKYQAIHESDWMLILNKSMDAIAVGKVYRIRSTLEHTTLYFDKYLAFDAVLSLSATSIATPNNKVSRMQWTDFVEGLVKLSGKTIADVPRIDEQAYIRELLQLAVTDDLLGPANGPYEEIVDMGVRDRYLVGKLAPRDSKKEGGIEGLDGHWPMKNLMSRKRRLSCEIKKRLPA